MTLVTVLLPTHDRADVLGMAIRSVLAQSVPEFELLVVGDGCTDATRDVVAAFDDPRIVWFDLPKAPLSGYVSRNHALRRARGRYVAYAQDDDLWCGDHLAQLLGAVAGREWAYSRPLWVGRSGGLFPDPVNLTHPDDLRHFRTVENSIPSTCVLHTRTALERAGHWPEDVPHVADWALWRTMLGSSTAAAGVCRAVTCLHFPSVRHGYVSVPEAALRETIGLPDWPAILRCPPGDGSPQAVLWRAMREGGAVWLADLRAATDAVMDHVAREALRREMGTAERVAARALADVAAVSAQLATAMDTAEATAGALDAARAEAVRQREALADVHRSHSWRLTAPLRAAADVLRGVRGRGSAPAH